MVMSDILGVLNMIILLLKYMFVSMVTFLNLFPGKKKVYGSLNRFECFFSLCFEFFKVFIHTFHGELLSCLHCEPLGEIYLFRSDFYYSF